MAGNKCGAKKVKDPATGYVFDSKSEFTRWCELRLLERAGKISGLKRQVKYELIPTQREVGTELYKAGPQKGLPKPGPVIEKPCAYVADFQYTDEDGNLVVEDIKGFKKGAVYALFAIKRKLMLYVHGIRVREIWR